MQEFTRDRHSRRAPATRRRNAFLRDFAIFWLGLLAMLLFWEHGLASLLATLLVFSVRLALWYERADLWIFAVGAVHGTAAEIVATRAGVWSYARPEWLGVPAWLPFAWGLAAVLIVRMAQNLPGPSPAAR